MQTGEVRTLASLSRLEKQWLKRKHCAWCEAPCLGKSCYSHSGMHELPVIEGVRDEPVMVDLGPPCNMDERRAQWLKSYKPRAPSTPTQSPQGEVE